MGVERRGKLVIWDTGMTRLAEGEVGSKAAKMSQG